MKTPALASILVLLVLASATSEEITFLYMKQSGYDLPDIVERGRAFQQATGIGVKPVFVEYPDRYSLIVQSAAGGAPDYDLILLDLIWTADFAEHRIIVPLPPALEGAVSEGIVPRISSAFQYRGRLWAMPFHADFQLLYTNLDLLAKAGYRRPPATLEELVAMARAAKRDGVIEYPIFDSWIEQEVLICEYTWLVGAFGGSLADAEGRIDCTTGPCVEALRFMTELLSEGLVNPYSLQSEENFVAEVFQSGDCLFTTNWSFLIRLLENADPSAPRWALSTIPASARLARTGVATSSVCGFEGLAVTASSRHQEAAWRFARFLDSPEFQGSHLEFMPVWKAVWEWPATRQGDPFMAIKQAQVNGLRYRPVHPRYGEVSAVLQRWIARALQGSAAPEVALQQAQLGIDAIVGGGR